MTILLLMLIILYLLNVYMSISSVIKLVVNTALIFGIILVSLDLLNIITIPHTIFHWY